MKYDPNFRKVGNSVRKYINSKKAEKYLQNTNNAVWIMVIDIVIVLISIATFYYIYFVNEDKILKYIGYGLIVFFLLFLVTKIYTLVRRDNNNGGISQLILLSEDGRSLKTWNIAGKV